MSTGQKQQPSPQCADWPCLIPDPVHRWSCHGEQLWWLSFVDPAKSAPRAEQVPGGPGFLGAAIVCAPFFLAAVNVATVLGCNPGGEVKAYPLARDDRTPHEYWGRLLTREDIDAIDAREADQAGGDPA